MRQNEEHGEPTFSHRLRHPINNDRKGVNEIGKKNVNREFS